MKKRKLQFDFWTVVTIGIIAVFALFLIYPLISLFIDGFLKEGTGEFTMANFQKFFGKKFYSLAAQFPETDGLRHDLLAGDRRAAGVFYVLL